MRIELLVSVHPESITSTTGVDASGQEFTAMIGTSTRTHTNGDTHAHRMHFEHRLCRVQVCRALPISCRRAHIATLHLGPLGVMHWFEEIGNNIQSLPSVRSVVRGAEDND